MNQLAKLDFWTYGIYKGTAVTAIPNAEAVDYFLKSSGGLIQKPSASATLYHHNSVAIPAASVRYGETLYLKDNYKQGFIIGLGAKTWELTTLGNNAISNPNGAGFEIHWNCAANEINLWGYTTAKAFVFTINSVQYHILWTHDAGLVIDGSSANWDAGSNAATNYPNTEAGLWSAMKIRVFFVGNDLYIKAQATSGASTVIAQKKIINGAIGQTFSGIKSNSTNIHFQDNLSLYRVTSGQAATYASTIDADITGVTITNDTLPFQRYTPLLDLIPIFGTDWTGSDGTAAQDLSDGDLTTYATTETKDAPIGFIASDGLTDTVTNAEWFMVAPAGVSEDFSSVGGPATPALHDVFLATSGGTFAADSVYPLLTMGDLMGRTYSWTPGTLTQLPTIGIIRNGSSMAFSVANTEAEDIRFKFGVPVNGDNINAFNYVQKDVTTGGNPFGETLATNNFDNGSGEFTDGTNTHTFLTSHPVIFTLERKT